jgi:hypothetical protein
MKTQELRQIIREEIRNALKNKPTQSQLNEDFNEKILTIGEAEDFLNDCVQDYINDTIDTAGEDLDFGNGVIGFDNGKQLIEDFINYLQGSPNRKVVDEAYNEFLDTDEGGWMREYIDKIAKNLKLDLKYRSDFDNAFELALTKLKKDHPELDFEEIKANKESFF